MESSNLLYCVILVVEGYYLGPLTNQLNNAAATNRSGMYGAYPIRIIAKAAAIMLSMDKLYQPSTKEAGKQKLVLHR